MGPFLVATTGRSGSSFVCRVLADRFGIDWGDVAPPTRANPEGAFECSQLRWLNKARARGEVNPTLWTWRLRELVKLRVRERGDRWGWKDPGLAPYLAEALEILEHEGIRFRILWPQRDVAACAASRARFYTDKSEAQWIAEMAASWEAICGALEGREHLALDFDRRWTEDEIADMLQVWLHEMQPAGEVA